MLTGQVTLVAPNRNTYAEMGTTWATSVITFPTIAAHLMGQRTNCMRPDRIVFGSDSVWYGSPQWQIDAKTHLQIHKERTGRGNCEHPELTEQPKRKILGLNSARR